MSRNELRFQNHIIDTYKIEGGTGKKWASEWAVGNPDLILSCSGVGVHLAEVKHRPTFTLSRPILNPMAKKQISVAREYVASGGLVFLYIVSGEIAVKSQLHIFDSLVDTTEQGHIVTLDYVAGSKYKGITNAIRRHCNERG